MSMSIERGLYEAIQTELRPGDNTLEFGSGLSTFAFMRPDTVHVAIENDRKQHLLINRTLGCCQYYPVNPDTGWYYETTPFLHRVILVDGPHGGHRYAGLEYILACSQEDTVFFIDDIHREEEHLLAKTIADRCGRSASYRDRWARI